MKSDCAGKHEKSKYRERHILGPEDIQTDPFEKYPPDNDEKIPQRVQICQPLNNLRHVGDREYKTAEHEEGQDKEECRHHGLLLC